MIPLVVALGFGPLLAVEARVTWPVRDGAAQVRVRRRRDRTRGVGHGLSDLGPVHLRCARCRGSASGWRLLVLIEFGGRIGVGRASPGDVLRPGRRVAPRRLGHDPRAFRGLLSSLPGRQEPPSGRMKSPKAFASANPSAWRYMNSPCAVSMTFGGPTILPNAAFSRFGITVSA